MRYRNPRTQSRICDASGEFTHTDSTGGSTGPGTGVEVCCLRLPSRKTVITIPAALNGQKSAWIGSRRSAPPAHPPRRLQFPPHKLCKKSPTSRLINLPSAVLAAGPTAAANSSRTAAAPGPGTILWVRSSVCKWPRRKWRRSTDRR